MAIEHKKKKNHTKFIAHAIQSKTHISIKLSKYVVQVMKHTQYINTKHDTNIDTSTENNLKKIT